MQVLYAIRSGKAYFGTVIDHAAVTAGCQSQTLDWTAAKLSEITGQTIVTAVADTLATISTLSQLACFFPEGERKETYNVDNWFRDAEDQFTSLDILLRDDTSPSAWYARVYGSNSEFCANATGRWGFLRIVLLF